MQRSLEAYSEAQAIEQRRLSSNAESCWASGDCHVEESSLYLGTSDSPKRERLFLPRRRPHCTSIGSVSVDVNVDEYLSRIPRVVRRIAEFSNNTTFSSRRHDDFSGAAPDLRSYGEHKEQPRRRCLNVLQGEVAHATSLQADLLVSSGATTCHIVALRSTTCGSDIDSGSPPLCTLAHVDVVNDECLENMIKEHLDHHNKLYTAHLHTYEVSTGSSIYTQDRRIDEPLSSAGDGGGDNYGFFDDDDDEQNDIDCQGGLQDDSPHFLPGWGDSYEQPILGPTPPMIDMNLHMVGGFLDEEGISKRLSAALIEQFDAMAKKYRGSIRMYLATAAVSSLNHNQTNAEFGWGYRNNSVGPVHRGLGIDTHTGQVFSVPASLPEQLAGPAMEIRSARRAFGNEPTLAVIHTADSEHIRVEPFCYTPDPKLNVLLQVPDAVLLSVASTSPHHESDTFCSNFRRTLSFVNTVPPESVFSGRPGEQKKPLVYTRSATNLHEWILADVIPNERVLCRSLAG